MILDNKWEDTRKGTVERCAEGTTRFDREEACAGPVGGGISGGGGLGRCEMAVGGRCNKLGTDGCGLRGGGDVAVKLLRKMRREAASLMGVKGACAEAALTDAGAAESRLAAMCG
jgi:hypothetical protein